MDDSNQGQADAHRREVLTFWAFWAFLAVGVAALGVDALLSYA